MSIDLEDLRRQAAAWRSALGELSDGSTRDRVMRSRVDVAVIAGVAAAESMIGTGENDRM